MLKITEKDFYKHLLLEGMFVKTAQASIEEQMKLCEDSGEITITVPSDELKLKCIKRVNGERVEFNSDFEIIYSNFFNLYFEILNSNKSTKEKEDLEKELIFNTLI